MHKQNIYINLTNSFLVDLKIITIKILNFNTKFEQMENRTNSFVSWYIL